MTANFTGSIPTFTVERARASKLQTLADFASAVTSAWSTWTPTLTNLTQGSGTVTARYRRIGKTVDYYWQFIYGTGSGVGTSPSFTLPVAPASHYSLSPNAGFPGETYLLDSSGGDRQGAVKLSSGSTVFVVFWNATPANAFITSTAPWTWATGDSITVYGTYEAA